MLRLVLSRGGRDELRIALHCFKDQLTSAVNRSAHRLRVVQWCDWVIQGWWMVQMSQQP